MSFLIENDLVWINIPKNASMSVANSIEQAGVNITYPFNFTADTYDHRHIALTELHQFFDNKETFCITREWLDRWMSALRFYFTSLERKYKDKLKLKWCDVNNDFIYSFFTDDLVNNLYYGNVEELNNTFSTLINGPIINDVGMLAKTLTSQNFWKGCRKCTYEFDINNLDHAFDFLSNRYNRQFDFYRINVTPPAKSKIELDDKLKGFIFDKFEKKYQNMVFI